MTRAAQEMNVHLPYSTKRRNNLPKTPRALAAATSCALLLLFGVVKIPAAEKGHFYSEEYGRCTNIKLDSLYSRILHREIPYSIYLPPGYFEHPDRRYPVIYYIHGFDTPDVAHKDWLNWRLDETLDRLIAAGEAREMIVVMPKCFSTGLVVNWGRRERPMLVSTLTFPFRLARGAFRSLDDPTYFGSYVFIHRWDLTPSHYADFFLTELIEHMERTYRIKRGPNSRALCGFSTGGYSSLSLALRNPGLFDSVSAHAPMLFLSSPFSPEADEFYVEYDPRRRAYIAHHFTINLLRRIFVNEATWKLNDPIALARKRDLEGLNVYIDVAENDRRRYDLAARELVEILKQRGVPVEFHLVEDLPRHSNHTYPGFLNGKLVADYARVTPEAELEKMFKWKGVKPLLNEVQRIEYSLRFHSRRFSEQDDGTALNPTTRSGP